MINIAPGTEEYKAAGRFCEYYNIVPCCNIRILKFAPLVHALLEQKNRQMGLPAGKVKLLTERYGLLEINITEEDVKVHICEEQDKDNIKITYEQAVHLLFSPLSPERELLSGQCPLIENWFPLPLYIEENDCI